MGQCREQSSSDPEDIRSEGGISALHPRNIDFMQDFAIQTGMTAADCCQEKGLHFAKGLGQPGRKHLIEVIKPPVAFLPSVGPVISQLFAKVFTNERMRVELPTIVRIF